MTPREPPSASLASGDADDPGEARERTALAWQRSALNMAASGTLIARAAFEGNLAALGVVMAIAMAMLSALTWRQGQLIYRARRLGLPPRLQAIAFALLTTATTLIAAIAIVVTIAL